MKGHLILLTAVGMVSFSSIFIRLSQAPPEILAAYRVALSFLILTPWVYRRRTLNRESLGGMSREDLLRSGAAGFFLALHFLLWIASLSYTTVASSVLLVTLHPLMVLPLAHLSGERIGKAQVAGAALALIGMVITTGGFQTGSARGDLLALAGAVMMGLYLLTGRQVRSRVSNLLYIWTVYGVAAVFLIVWILVLGRPLFAYPAVEFALFLGLAVIPTIGGHGLFNWALASMGAARVSVSILGEPVGASILAWLILAEAPTASEMVGGGAILLGLVLALNRERAPGREAKPNLRGVKP